MTRDELKALQGRKLAFGLRLLASSNPFYRKKFVEFDAGAVAHALDAGDLDPLRGLPFTTKSELLHDQERNPPYGTNLSYPRERYVRVHQTSGTSGRPLRWLDTPENWDWLMGCWNLIYDAVGLTPTDRLFFPFSFGPFLGFWAGFEGACRRGNFVLAGGGTTTVARLQLAIDHQISCLLCTPTYALRLAEVAEEEGIGIRDSTIRTLILAGEPGASIPSVRQRIESAFGARVFDHCGMTEIGSLGIEFESHPGKTFLLETEAIAEFLDPTTLEPVAEGELGELVLTNLGRWGSPLLRYRTGDIVRWRADLTPNGQPFVYLEGGILGRTDEMFYIRGNSVYPTSIETILRERADVAEFILEIFETNSGHDLTIVVEPTTQAMPADKLSADIGKSIQDRLHFRAEVRVAEPGSLPRHEMKARRIRRFPERRG
ncbi:MAG: AMP-binding protein [Planctomycetota bacterium]